jgi:hypothetical protein
MTRAAAAGEINLGIDYYITDYSIMRSRHSIGRPLFPRSAAPTPADPPLRKSYVRTGYGTRFFSFTYFFLFLFSPAC